MCTFFLERYPNRIFAAGRALVPTQEKKLYVFKGLARGSLNNEYLENWESLKHPPHRRPTVYS